MKFTKHAGSRCCLGILFVLTTLGASTGCGALDDVANGIGTDDSSITANTTDARDTGAVALNIVFRGFVAAFGNSGANLQVNQSASQLITGFKNTITASSTSHCSQENLADPTGTTVTINGDVSGSCDITASGTDSGGTVLAQCSDYNDAGDTGDVTVNGDISADIDATSTSTESGFVFTNVTSSNLHITLSDGSYCSAVVNFSASETIEISSGSGTVTMLSGACDTICGEAFAISGSDNF
ncbi:MAG: hypothetical protein HQM16_04485 [Deltaproteobacteria bacterium]|nr:hypothetical protein [Deltaproteobacteria bacterium]